MVSLGFPTSAWEPGSFTGSSVPLGAPAAPAVAPLPRGLEDPGVLMTFQSEVLPQPSCISSPELPVCESRVFGRAHIRKSGETVRQSAADGGVQSSCLAGAGIIISMGIPKGALVAHQ